MTENKSERRRLITGLGLGYFINSAQELSLPQLFPVMRHAYRPPLTNTDLAVIDGARIIIQTFLTPVWGLLADRYSRKWVLVIGTGLWGGLAIFCGMSHNYWQLLIAWVISLLGLGALVPAGFNMLADLYPSEERGLAIGVLNALGMLGIIVFGLAAGPFLEAGGEAWRYLFFIVGGLSVLVGIFIAVFVQETVRGAAEPELSGLITELAASQFRFRGSDLLEILRTPTILVAFVQGFFMLSSLYTLMRFFPTWLVDDRGFREEQAPLVFGGVVISLAVGSIAGGIFSDWADRRWPHGGRALISQVSLLMILPGIFIMVTWAKSAIAVIAVAVFLAFFLEWTRRATIQPLIQNVARPELRGTALALGEFATGGLASILVIFFGNYSDRFGLNQTFLLGCGGTAGLALLSSLLYYIFYPSDLARLREKMRERREQIISQQS